MKIKRKVLTKTYTDTYLVKTLLIDIMKRHFNEVLINT